MKNQILIAVLVCLSLSAFAQKQDLNTLSRTERLAITKSALADLKAHKATLIVRMPSNAKKIKATERLANSKDLSPKQVEKMKKMHTAAKVLTPAFNSRLMTAFSENFDFADLLFMHDTASIALNNGIRKGIFLNKRAETDPDIHLENEQYYLLDLDVDGYPMDMSLVDVDMLNSNKEKLPSPFPQDARGGFLFTINLLFKKDYDERQKIVMDKIVKKYNSKLYKAYDKYF